MIRDEAVREVFDRCRGWADAAHLGGWIDAPCRAAFEEIETAAPGDLVHDAGARPLVVAFFGGTGVGKSSLLNRIAGQPLAEVSAVRPTSHRVTLYVHHAVGMAALPGGLPLDRVDVRRHEADRWRQVVWIDTPDIDSVEPANCEAALAWAPLADLICYVVTPERYRDDAGWRLLLTRRARHGWVFVMNRWDEGCDEQRDDFAAILTRQAGFAQPVLFVTSCLSGESLFARRPPSPDQYPELLDLISRLALERAGDALAQQRTAALRADISRCLADAAAAIGDDASWAALDRDCAEAWVRAADSLSDGLDWTLRSAALKFAVHDRPALSRSLRGLIARGEPAAASAPPSAEAGPLWDAWADAQTAAHVDACEVACTRRGLPFGALRPGLEAAAAMIGPAVDKSASAALRTALARPGSALTRTARQVTGFLMTFLPCAALGWVAFGVVRGFWRGVHADGEFLGAGFAINSALLVLVAWLVPFLLDRALRPSLERTALRAMRGGVRTGLDDAAATLSEAVGAARRDAELLRRDAAALAAECGVGAAPADTRIAPLLAATAP